MALRFLQHSLGFSFSTTGRTFVLHKHKYLVEEKPTKPSSAYNLFAKQYISGKSKTPITERMQKAGEEWNNLSEDKKKKFQEQAQEQKKKIKPLLAQYNQKYVKPFKRQTALTLFMKKGYENKTFVFSEADSKDSENRLAKYTKVTTEAWKILPKEEKDKLAAEAKAINAKNQEISKKFEVPQPIYTSQRHYNMKNVPAGGKIAAAEKERLVKEYEVYVATYKAVLTKWLEERGLTAEEYQDIVKKALRADKRAKKEKQEDEDDE